MEEEPYLWAVMRYIEQDPVLAKLIKKEEYYQWSSARAHILGIKDEVLSKESQFSDKEIESYREFLRRDVKGVNALIRRATSTGRPRAVMFYKKTGEDSKM